MPRILIPAAYALARVFHRLRLHGLSGRLAYAAWLAEVRERGGPSVR